MRGRVPSAEAVGDIVIRSVDNHPILVRDVGQVDRRRGGGGHRRQLDGKEAVVLSIRKQSGENSVAVVDALRERMKELDPTMPSGYKLEVIRDNTETTRTSVDAVQEHLVLGAILASLVVLLFLGNFRSTLIAALAIPTSIIGTFMLMWLMGFTLNTITLLALALAVGIVIDDAIVVLENIFRFVNEKKIRPMPAAIYATKEIGLAVLATTLSLLAVFMPVAFMSSIPGRFLRSFGLTMGVSIAISLFVSFTLTPMLASRWLRLDLRPDSERRKSVLERLVDVFYRPIERVYMRVLAFVIDRRWIVVVAAVATLGAIVPAGQGGAQGLLAQERRGAVRDQPAHAGGDQPGGDLAVGRAHRARGARLARGVGDAGDHRRQQPEDAQPGDDLRAPGAARPAQALAGSAAGQGARGDRPQAAARRTASACSAVSAFSGGGFSTATVQYTLTGPDLNGVINYSKKVVEKLKAIPGAVDVDTTLVTGNPEVVAVVNRRKAADLGVNVADVATAAQLLVGGVKVSRYEEEGREYDILVRADEQFHTSPEALALLSVPSSRLGAVPLLDVVDLKHAEGPSKINRYARQVQVTFLANTAPGVGAGEVGAALEKAVKQLKLPPQFRFVPFGQSKEIERTGKNFIIAFGLAFIFMYLILAAQFESWLHPVTILLALPLTVPFALMSLLIFGQSLDIFTMLGVLVLFGVVKKNSILQIDHINQLRAEGNSRRDAILHGNRDRLRPILMTTMAFVAGMLPLVISKGIGAEFNRATAGPVVGGQILSLLLTLLATPVAYSLFDDLANFTRRVLRIKRARTPRPAPTRSCPSTSSSREPTDTVLRRWRPGREGPRHEASDEDADGRCRDRRAVGARFDVRFDGRARRGAGCGSAGDSGGRSRRAGGRRGNAARPDDGRGAGDGASAPTGTWSSSARGWRRRTPTSSRPGRRCSRWSPRRGSSPATTRTRRSTSGRC